MGQLVFSQVPVEGWVIDADKHGLLNCPGDTVCLPVYNGETVHMDTVSFGLAVLVDRGGGSEVYFSLSPKVLPDSLIYSSSQSACMHLNQYIIPLF